MACKAIPLVASITTNQKLVFVFLTEYHSTNRTLSIILHYLTFITNKIFSPKVSAGLDARLIALLCFLDFFHFFFAFLSFSFCLSSCSSFFLSFSFCLSCCSFSFQLFSSFIFLASAAVCSFSFISCRTMASVVVVDCFSSSTCFSWQRLR